MVRGGGMGIASPYCTSVQFGSYPLPAGRSRGIVQGARWPAEPRSSRVHRSTPAHPPVAALLPLGGALRWLPAVAPMVPQGQPRTVGQEGDKSVEAVPWPWLTFNLAQMHRGMDKIRPRSARIPISPGSVISAAQKTLSNSTYWGFSLCGAANPIP